MHGQIHAQLGTARMQHAPQLANWEARLQPGVRGCGTRVPPMFSCCLIFSPVRKELNQ